MKSEAVVTNGEKVFVLVFDKGDEVLQGLKSFAEGQGLSGSRFTAIGALSDVTLGYFDRERKSYKRIPLREQVEVLSLTGNIAFEEGGHPKIHAHIVVGDSMGSAFGGHLLGGHVWPTLEVVIEESPGHLQRRMDPDTGLALIDLDSQRELTPPSSR